MGHVLFYLRHPQNILKNLNSEADPSRLKEIETKLKGVNISIAALDNQKEEKGKLESQLLAYRENLGEVKVVERVRRNHPFSGVPFL